MAITATKTPAQTVMNKSTRPLILTLTSTLSNQESFRYTLDLKVNNVVVTSLESAGNPVGSGHFDLHTMTQSYLSAQVKASQAGTPLHTLESTYSYGPDQMKKFSVVWGERYINGSGVTITNTYPSDEYWWFQHNGNFNIQEDSYNDPFYHFSLRNTSTQGRFLCTQRVIETYEGQWGVLGCLNIQNSTWTSPGPRDPIEKFVYTFYDSNNVQLGTADLSIPSATVPDMNSDALISTGVLYIPIHYKNVRSLNSTAFDASAYFTVYGYNSAALGFQITEIMKVNINHQCEDRKYFNIGFINRFGAWEYKMFTGRNMVEIDFKRKDFNKLSSDWSKAIFDTSAIDFGASGGERSYSVIENYNIALNSEYMTESEAEEMYHMFQSDYIVVFTRKTQGGEDSDYIYNGRIKNSKTKIKTNRWDRLIQFTINVELISADYK